MLGSSRTRRARSARRLQRWLAASLCTASFLTGHLLFGQQPAELARPTLQPLKRVAIEAAPATNTTSEQPQVRPALLSVKPGEQQRVQLASAVEENTEDSLPPILSGTAAPRRPAKLKAKGPGAGGQGPGVVESSRRVVPVGQRPEVGGRKPEIGSQRSTETAAIPAGAPGSNSPWMQDIRQLIDTTPGAKKFTSPPSSAVAPVETPVEAPAAVPLPVVLTPASLPAALPAVAPLAIAAEVEPEVIAPLPVAMKTPVLAAPMVTTPAPTLPAPVASAPVASTAPSLAPLVSPQDMPRPLAPKAFVPPTPAPVTTPAAMLAPPRAAPLSFAPSRFAPSNFNAVPSLPVQQVQFEETPAPVANGAALDAPVSPLVRAARATVSQPFAPAPLAVQNDSAATEQATPEVAAEPAYAPIATSANVPPPSKRFPLAPTRNVPAAATAELPSLQPPTFNPPPPADEEVASSEPELSEPTLSKPTLNEPALAPIMNRPAPLAYPAPIMNRPRPAVRESLQDRPVASPLDRPSTQTVHFNQPPAPQPLNLAPMADPMPADAMRAANSPFEVIDESGEVTVSVRRSKLLRTKVDIYRTAVVDDSICDVVQFTPREVSLIGKSQGSTHVTFWFDDPKMQPVTYLVRVAADAQVIAEQENTYRMLQDVINEMFPDSKIQLLVVADKLIIRGQAKDSEEAAQIVALVRSQSGGNNTNTNGGFGGSLSEGAAAQVLSDSATGAAQRARLQVINMLRVPGVQQVALRVKIAEMNRSAARGFGVDVKGHINFSENPNGSQMFLQSMLNVAAGSGPALLTQFDGDDIQVGVRYLQQHGVIRLLSEPTLVTMSGTPATFIAGGEFAVPTLVGSAGLNAVTTDFRAFGAIISFMPTVVDKDRIRLQVSPEFSQINSQLSVGGTPGLKVRAATTTVEMREGQTLAIAGLLEDNMNGTNTGDLPFLAKVFGRRDMSRNETELLILVTPELVQALEPEEVPPLPGFDITEPTSAQFFLHGQLEGNPTQDYRSTVWPRLKKRYGAGGPAMTSGPFGHGQ